jgi:hypothetical protein
LVQSFRFRGGSQELGFEHAGLSKVQVMTCACP